MVDDYFQGFKIQKKSFIGIKVVWKITFYIVVISNYQSILEVA